MFVWFDVQVTAKDLTKGVAFLLHCNTGEKGNSPTSLCANAPALTVFSYDNKQQHTLTMPYSALCVKLHHFSTVDSCLSPY